MAYRNTNRMGSRGWGANRDRLPDANLDYGFRGGDNQDVADETGGSRGSNRDYGYNRGIYRGDSRRYDHPWYAEDEGDQGDWDDYDEDANFNPGVPYGDDWDVPGPYRGMGPNGYRRSDEGIMEDINDRLTRHGRINASAIHIDVKNGDVTLTGTVHSRNEKRMAEDVADSVSGVKDVHNQLKVAQGAKQAAR